MGDQLIPSNRQEHFADLRSAHLASGKIDSFPNITPSFTGAPRPWVVIMDEKTGAIESFELTEGIGHEFSAAKAIWEGHGKPRLWLFWDLASAPWKYAANT